MLEKSEISLDCIPTEVHAPASLSPSEKADWYKERLEAMSATRQYIAYCNEQIEAVWQSMQTRLHDAQRAIVEVKVLPTRKPREAKAPRQDDSIAEMIETIGLSEAQKDKLAEMLNVKRNSPKE